MSEQFIQGIVRILNDRGEVGTGFVVSESGLIATCSHVIQREDLQERLPRPEKVKVLFYMTGDELDARVEPDWWLPCKAGDLAILSLEGALPPGVQPLLLGSSKGTGGHDISTFGFPDIGDIEGIGGDGKVVQLLSSSERTLIQLRSNEITVGFSGAPIWDKLTQRVIGVVSEIANPDPNFRLIETAFALSTEMLRNLCPLLQISDICPYLGLAAFQEADAKFFFGRQLVIDSILDRVRQEPRFLIVLGPSGSGKSSVMQAGFIPQLKTGKISMSNRWEVFIMRPANDPFAALAKQGLADGTHTLIENVEAWLHLHSKQERLVLIFDQFEDVFVTCPEVILQSFVEQITQLLQSSQPISVILVMRDDFYSQMAQHETLMVWVAQSGGPFQIPQHLKEGELQDIVQKPAEEVGLRFEKGLVEAIVRDTMETALEDGGLVGRSAVLPLLESALHELWKEYKEHDEGMLTHKAYKTIGTVVGALNRWAEQAYFELKEEHRQLARRVFTDLIYLGDKNQGILDSRRRRTLAALSRQDREQQDVEYVVHHLAEDRHRLLVTDRDTQTSDETVEMIHDVLLRRWGMLKQWIKDDQEFLQWHQEVEKPAQVWREQGDKNRLLRGRDLREAKKQMEKHRADLSQDEVAFLRASAKYSINLLVRTMVVVLLLVSLTGATGWYYLHQAADPARVTNLSDDGPGSLRFCINNIQSGTITFAPGLKGVIKLTSGEITIKGKVTIDGPGSGVLAVSSGKTNSAIFISSGASVTISGLSFRDSSFTNRSSFLNNSGTLSLVNSTLSNNQSGITGVINITGTGSGGAIENSGILSVINSRIVDNSAFASFFGGSAYLLTGGGFGGGIYNTETGTVTVMNSTISGNAANIGGGIESGQGTVTVINSTISGNSAWWTGGGIDTTGKLTIVNSTLANNTVGNPYPQTIYGAPTGGGIYATYHQTGPVHLLLAFDTIYGNTSSGTGGAIENDADILTIEDSIIAGNNTSHGSDIAGQVPPTILGGPGLGLVTTWGYNLFQNVTGVSFTDPNGLQNTDMIVNTTDLSNILGPNPQLQDNGAATKTYALLPVSSNPAIGKIPLQYCHVPEMLNEQSHQYTDQRGAPRPTSGEQFCDIGAYEVGKTPIAASQPTATITPSVSGAVIPNPNAQYFYCIVWSGTQFVAVGSSGTILTSRDGSTWTAQSSGIQQDLSSIVWSGTQFVAVGDGTILTSPNGSGWRTIQSASIQQNLYGIAWSGTQFVAVGSNGTILTSPNGSAWTVQSAEIEQTLNGVAWSGTQFIAVGEDGTILTSPNGSTWTDHDSSTLQLLSLYGVVWSGHQFVVVGENGPSSTVLTSPNGSTWTVRFAATEQTLNGVAGSGGQFITVGDNGTIFTSPDGSTWTAQSSGTAADLESVVWSGTQFVAVGYGSTILTSRDGSTWSGFQAK